MDRIAQDEANRTTALEKLREYINVRLQETSKQVYETLTEEIQDIMPIKV